MQQNLEKTINAESFEQRFLLYMDILGAENIILSGQTKAIKELVEIFSANNKEYSEIDHPVHSGIISLKTIEPNISSFSDHIIISLPFKNDDFNIWSDLRSLFHHASWLQHMALKKGMLMRGAIVRGDLWHEKNIVLGKALIQAVYMEEKVAIYPRVIVSDEVIKDLPKNKAYLLKRDFDGFYYVNYIKDERYAPKEALIDIFNLLDRKLKDKEIFSDIVKCSKWRWLALKFGYPLD